MEKVADIVENIEETHDDVATSRIYELGINLLPSIVADDVPREFGNIKAIIEKNGGAFIAEDMPKLRPLAYALSKVVGTKREKFNDAYFGWVKFEADSEQILSIKKDLETEGSILRFLIVKTVRESTLMQPKFSTRRGEFDKKPDVSPDAPAAPINPESIDASIEKLVIE